MDAKAMRIIGVVCLVICAICIFVAVERYQTNADNVAAMNKLRGSMPVSPFGQTQMKPATPAATKYALFFALLSGAGGVVCLVKSSPRQDPGGTKGPGDDEPPSNDRAR